MDARFARLVREVGPGETEEELINEARAYTWTHGVEVALVSLISGGRVFLAGGRDGITFEVRNPENDVSTLLVECPGGPLMVSRIDWHTHPVSTGPSDGDREAIRRLGQAESRIFEIGGGRDGTWFGPDRGQPGGD